MTKILSKIWSVVKRFAARLVKKDETIVPNDPPVSPVNPDDVTIEPVKYKAPVTQSIENTLTPWERDLFYGDVSQFEGHLGELEGLGW